MVDSHPTPPGRSRARGAIPGRLAGPGQRVDVRPRCGTPPRVLSGPPARSGSRPPEPRGASGRSGRVRVGSRPGRPVARATGPGVEASPTPMTVADISVVIVNYNAGPLLDACLRSVRQFAGDLAIELVVVDNASTDGSLGVLRAFPEVQGLVNPANVGFARAVNQALEVAKGRFVLLLNPDTRLVSPVLQALLVFAAAHPQAGIIGPLLVNPDGTLQTSAYRFPTLFQAAGTILGLRRLVPVGWLRAHAGRWLGRYFGQLDPHATARPVDLVTGACMLIRREVIEAIGGLDPRFFLYFEEKDFCLRARGAGWLTYFDPSAKVIHAIGGSSRGDPAITVVERCRSMRQYHDKHGGPATRLALRVLFAGGGLFRLAGALLSGDRRAARAWREVVSFAVRRRIER